MRLFAAFLILTVAGCLHDGRCEAALPQSTLPAAALPQCTLPPPHADDPLAQTPLRAAAKACPCSPGCTCGCNAGRPCSCGAAAGAYSGYTPRPVDYALPTPAMQPGAWGVSVPYDRGGVGSNCSH
jgi:hypothetical protein